MSSTEIQPAEARKERVRQEHKQDEQIAAGTREPDGFYIADRDPEYRYRWMNRTRDVHLSEKTRIGWEFVKGSELPPEIARQVLPKGQETETPAGGQIRMRGDLVLMRMTRDDFERKVNRPIEQRRHRQRISIDTLVATANQNAQKLVRDRHGAAGVRDAMVFKTSATPGFEDVESASSKD